MYRGQAYGWNAEEQCLVGAKNRAIYQAFRPSCCTAVRVFDVVGTVLCVPALLVRLQRLINVIWCRRGDSVHTRRARDSGWRNLGGSGKTSRGSCGTRHCSDGYITAVYPREAFAASCCCRGSNALVQYGIQSLLKPMLQIETVRMTGQEKVERATALVSQITMMSNILGPVVGTAVYGCFGIDTLCATASVTFAISALLFGGALKQNASSETMGDCATRTTCRNDFRESIRYLLQNSSLVAVILLAAVLNLALVGLTIGAPIIVAKHLGMQSSCVGIVEVALGLGGLTGSGLVGIWPHRFSLNGICRYVAMICFGVVPIIVTLLSGPDELAFAALAAGSAWVMAWASITSVEIVSFVQRSAPKKLCGKVLALVYMTLSCATPIGQLIYGLAYDRWTPAIVFAGMLAVLTLTTALFYRLKSRLWRLS